MGSSSIGDRLKKLRLQNNLTLEEVGNKIDASKQTLYKYENDIITNIPSDKIERLSQIYGVSPSYLMGWDDANAPTIKSLITKVIPGNMVNLPIIGKISCGAGVLIYDGIEGYEPTPADWLNGGEYFYTRAKGDSMINARIQDGDLVLIKKQSDVDDGEIAAILIDEDIFLKRVYKRNDSVILQSENPKYPPMIADPKNQSCIIIGKLKKVIINM